MPGVKLRREHRLEALGIEGELPAGGEAGLGAVGESGHIAHQLGKGAHLVVVTAGYVGGGGCSVRGGVLAGSGPLPQADRRSHRLVRDGRSGVRMERRMLTKLGGRCAMSCQGGGMPARGPDAWTPHACTHQRASHRPRPQALVHRGHPALAGHRAALAGVRVRSCVRPGPVPVRRAARGCAWAVGILFSPFLHGSVEHLLNNSSAILVLGWLLVYFYPKAASRVVLAGWLISRAWVWAFARENYHIGASGVVYGLAAFLFFSGLVRKRIRAHGGVAHRGVALWQHVVGHAPVGARCQLGGHLSGGRRGCAHGLALPEGPARTRAAAHRAGG